MVQMFLFSLFPAFMQNVHAMAAGSGDDYPAWEEGERGSGDDRPVREEGEGEYGARPVRPCNERG